MVMFKAKFQPQRAAPQGRPQAARGQQQQQPQPDTPEPTAPPIEKERGPQYPVREPGPAHEPERARSARANGQGAGSERPR